MLRRILLLAFSLLVFSGSLVALWGMWAQHASLSREKLLWAQSHEGPIPQQYVQEILDQHRWLLPRALVEAVERPDRGEMDFPFTHRELQEIEERFRARAALSILIGGLMAILGLWGLVAWSGR